MSLDYGIYNNLVNNKIDELLKNVSLSLNSKQYEVIKLAINVSSHGHKHQKRKSGEPYIIHPLEVANIVTKWGMDMPTIAAAIMHDTIEDTAITKADLNQIFGLNIAELVDSVTKLDKLNFDSEESANEEYFRKVVLSMAKDLRVIVIKLADRLHNIQTLESMSNIKRKRIAKETLEIYFPIANKIGLYNISLILADESFRHLYPYRYKVLSNAILKAKQIRKPLINSILINIENAMKSNGINGRIICKDRSIYNIYLSMKSLGQSFNRIYNIFEIKIVVKKSSDCYMILWVVHSLYQPLPNTFKDYIAISKSNGYQSLHSTLMGPNGTPIQIHIRTESMDQIAENGILTYWLKEHYSDAEFVNPFSGSKNLINNILDIQSSTFSANDFMSSLKSDLIPSDIYVFTPKSKIILLPRGATVLDFAYSIHSDLGSHCHHALVNKEKVNLNHKLKSGDIVEIISYENVEPSEDWLSLVVTGKAISKIKQFFKEQKFDEDVNKGKILLETTLNNFEPTFLENKNYLDIILHKTHSKFSKDDFLHKVGTGNLSILNVIKKLLNIQIESVLNINLRNFNLPISADQECLPLPGEIVLGKINKKCELELHKLDCKEIKKNSLDFFTKVIITNNDNKTFSSKIQIIVPNEPGIFARVSGIMWRKNFNMIEISQPINSGKIAYVHTTICVNDINQVKDLLKTLQHKSFIFNAMLV